MALNNHPEHCMQDWISTFYNKDSKEACIKKISILEFKKGSLLVTMVYVVDIIFGCNNNESSINFLKKCQKTLKFL
jgi:hypothetical protein